MLDKLINEEIQAVNSYKKAIKLSKDPKQIKVFEHILDEELEHIKELEELKRTSKFSDSILQEYESIRKANEKKYGKDFYNYVNKYLAENKGLVLSDLYYKEEEWDKFIKWYNNHKTLKDEVWNIDNNQYYIITDDEGAQRTFSTYKDAYRYAQQYLTCNHNAFVDIYKKQKPGRDKLLWTSC